MTNMLVGHTKQKNRLRNDDSGVSPVIGTILMVAVTVMMSAGVYVWTSVFNDGQEPPENVSIRASTFDSDGNGSAEWVRLTLVSAKDAPYDLGDVQVTVLHGSTVTPPALCLQPDGVPCTDAFDPWAVGTTLFIACEGAGKNTITVTVRGHTVLDDTLTCGASPTAP